MLRSNFELGERVRFFPEGLHGEPVYFVDGYVHQVTHHREHTEAQPMCAYIVKFNDETIGDFNNDDDRLVSDVL